MEIIEAEMTKCSGGFIKNLFQENSNQYKTQALNYQIEILYPYRTIVPDRRGAASHIIVLSIIPHPQPS
jgi:hypothetical protein